MPDYKSDAGLLAHLQIQKQNIGQFKAEVGADGDDQTSIVEDCDNMQAIMDFCTLADEYKTSAFGIKFALIRGETGAGIGDLMTAPVFTPPHPLNAGIEKRSRERDQRFKRSKTITEAARQGMDLTEDKSNLTPDLVKPSATFTEANSGYLFSVVITGRGEADSWDVIFQRDGETTWSLAKTATGKSVDVTITPSTPGKPERFKVRVQLKKNNQNYGQPSDIDEVTLNP